MTKQNKEITFKDILSVFIPKLWIIVVVALLFASIFAFYSAFIVEDTYTSYSVMCVRKNTEALQVTDIALAESIIDIVSYRINAPDFLNKILLYVNQTYDGYETLSLSLISSSIRYIPQGSGILKLSVTTQNRHLSYAIAQALENAVPNEFYSVLGDGLTVESYSSAFLPSVNDKGVFKNFVSVFLAVRLFQLSQYGLIPLLVS